MCAWFPPPNNRLQMGHPFINTYILFIGLERQWICAVAHLTHLSTVNSPNPSSPHRGCICESKCKRNGMDAFMDGRETGRETVGYFSRAPYVCCPGCVMDLHDMALSVSSPLSEALVITSHTCMPIFHLNPSRNRLALLVAPNYTWLA